MSHLSVPVGWMWWLLYGFSLLAPHFLPNCVEIRERRAFEMGFWWQNQWISYCMLCSQCIFQYFKCDIHCFHSFPFSPKFLRLTFCISFFFSSHLFCHWSYYMCALNIFLIYSYSSLTYNINSLMLPYTSAEIFQKLIDILKIHILWHLSSF